MIRQIDARESDGARRRDGEDRKAEPLSKRRRGVGVGGVRGVAEQQEKGEVEREEGDELGVRAGHAVALAVHFCGSPCQRGKGKEKAGEEEGERGVRLGLSSLISRFNPQFSASQAICPANISATSASRLDQISVA